jgi:ascorbate PTS system EIIB component
MSGLKIMTVCGFGLGSSMILKITLDRVLEENNIRAETFCADEITAVGESFDIVFTSKEMVHLFDNETRPVIVIENFLSKNEIRQKGLDIIKLAINK